ncbi:MAG: MFS transporter, partial [Varibaculum cambriense]|nr:MFS transporter [Varibaculum cambriense]
ALKRVRIPEKDGDLAEEIDEMMANNRKAEKQEKGTLGDVFRTPWIRKLLFIGCFIAIANQLTGVNTIMYYAPKVLQYAGMSTQAAITAQIANGVMSVIGCSIAVFIIMKFTRRKIYITTEFLIFLILGTVAIMFAIFIEPAMAAKVNPPVWSALVILALMAVFMLVMQTGSSPVMFTVMGEMFPQKVRGVASGAAICTLWIANAIITVSFPKMMESLGGAGTYGVFAVINLLVGIILWKIMPETSGKSLEELEEEFEERYS